MNPCKGHHGCYLMIWNTWLWPVKLWDWLQLVPYKTTLHGNCFQSCNAILEIQYYWKSERLLFLKPIQQFSSYIMVRTTGARGTDSPPPPLFLTFCLQIYFQSNFFISLLFHFFFLILTCSCQYSYNLMSTSNCMCRPYIDTNIRQATCLKDEVL